MEYTSGEYLRLYVTKIYCCALGCCDWLPKMARWSPVKRNFQLFVLLYITVQNMGAWLSRARKALQRMKIYDPVANGDEINLGPRLWRRNSSPSKQIKRAGKYQRAKLWSSTDQQHLSVSTDVSGSEHSMSDSRTPSPSPLFIRQQRIRTLEETRPELTEEQIDLLRSTWKVIQSHTSTVGYDMFNR